jgi:prephenate dehydrogenase
VIDDQGERHDRVMAAVSHLPQVTASALMVVAANGVSAEELAWAGAGLRDTTRLASSRADVWQGILATNKDLLAPLLKQLAADLDTLADSLDDPAAVGELFDAAVRAKASCL